MAEANEKIVELHQLFMESAGVCTDTRKIVKDSLFFALKGASFNGNDFALQALEQGAKYAVVDNPALLERAGSSNSLILVDDVLSTLQALARYHRLRFHIPVLALTGTNGKTTTKELIAAVLRKRYNVLATEGNLNNHIGVPLTLLKLDKSVQAAVIEMGASAPGEIKRLVEIVCPTFGLITSIGKAHLMGFGSLDGVMQTKGELLDDLLAHRRIAFINVDNPYIAQMLAKRQELHYVPYGVVNDRAEILPCTLKNPTLRLSIPNPLYGYSEKTMLYPRPTESQTKNKRITVESRLIGSYNADNVLAALCVGTYFGIPLSEAADAVREYRPTNNRSQMVKGKSCTLIVDAYNANPTSMRASIENFAQMQFKKKILLLGDMLELGESSLEEHKEIIKLAISIAPEKIFLVGKEFEKAVASLAGEGCDKCADISHFQNVEGCIEALEKDSLTPDSTLLVKGSHGIHLEKILNSSLV